MIRLLLTFCVGITSVVGGHFSAHRALQFDSPAPLFSEIALSPAPAFMAHVVKASAYKIRRLLAPYGWALAGDVPIKTQIWEFQPAKHAPANPLRMDDSNL